jgi:glutamyl-tRNA synthetase
MSTPPDRTRFAPSPTGALHLGNARTALFNWLDARHRGGAFAIRSEDTDPERSDEAHLTRMLDDLAWLGLDWDEGPDRGGPGGPYRQSGRGELYREHLERLCAVDAAYPCFCTREELEAVRQRQRAAGRPPRYPGTCARLTEAERAAQRARGRTPAVRFRVPPGREVAFTDLVRGPQAIATAEIGDFVICRADGVAAFLFANALDDALMGVTRVLRGEDHLANTPRQILLLEALGLTAPDYGHLALITGPDGRPLAKREGGASLRALRETGYRPEAVVNHLARLGYTPPQDDLLDLGRLSRGFDPGRAGRASARHDDGALDAWQRRAIERLDVQALWSWVAAARPVDAPELPVAGTAFVEVVRANIERPADAWAWARRLFDPDAEPTPEAAREIAAAGPLFFRQAADVGEPSPWVDFAQWARAVGRATGTRGRGLYRPLRAALTGTVEGPELAAVVGMLPEGLLRARLRAAGAD